MAGHHNKGSKAKSTDVMATPGEQTRGRAYYECTFCKMGFSNAQALGGHMNIHRRDRQRPSPTQPKAVPETGAAGYGYLNNDADSTYYCSNDACYWPSPPAASTSWRNCADVHTSSTSGGMDVRAAVRGDADAYMSSGMPQELSFYGEELRLSLGIGGRASHAAEEGEIDLELRLGR